jgi:MraZ protein
MNFSGEKYATVDEKGRVVLPADFKNEMGGIIPGGQLVVARDTYEKCLNIFTLDSWEKQLNILKEGLNPNNQADSRMLDYIYSTFKIVSVPDNYRINLPNNFIEKAGIVKDVIFIGRDDRIRLWSAEVYNTYGLTDEEFREVFAKKYGGKEV